MSGRGKQVLRGHPDRVDVSVLAQFAEYQDFRARKSETPLSDTETSAAAGDLSPSQAVGAIVADSDSALAEELLDRILAQPLTFLETLALKLLQAMGYGGREALMEHTGKSGDSGLNRDRAPVRSRP